MEMTAEAMLATEEPELSDRQLAILGRRMRGRSAGRTPRYAEAAWPIAQNQLTCANCGRPSGEVALTKEGTEYVCARGCEFQRGLATLRGYKRLLRAVSAEGRSQRKRGRR